jgi:hypothetical protein
MPNDKRRTSFTLSAAKRVVRATRYVETLPQESLSTSSTKIAPRTPFVYAKITAATAINGGIRWKYTLRVGCWDMTSGTASGGTWVDLSGGTDSFAFNSAEDMNTFTSGTGAIGTGNTNVTQSDGTINGSSCKLVPLPVGGYVVMILRGADASGNLYYTIVNLTSSAQ